MMVLRGVAIGLFFLNTIIILIVFQKKSYNTASKVLYVLNFLLAGFCCTYTSSRIDFNKWMVENFEGPVEKVINSYWKRSSGIVVNQEIYVDRYGEMREVKVGDYVIKKYGKKTVFISKERGNRVSNGLLNENPV